MSLAELTRNSFQAGISATKWLNLSKLYISKSPEQSREDTASNLSNSVLILFRSYPGDPTLQEYLKVAIQDGLLPVYTYVSTLLQAARSSELHIPATLDTLVRTALDAHYSSGKPPIGSVVAEDESISSVMRTIQDALALLRTAHTLPLSHFHQLTTSAAELVDLLIRIACATDLTRVPATQAIVLYGELSETMNTCRLNDAVAGILDAFMVTLSLVIGEDVKATGGASMMHTATQFAPATGKGDISGPSSETDLITLGLVLNHIVTYMAHDWGAGDTANAVALLIGAFRWSSWTPTIFYTQLLLSAFSCLSQHVSNARLWKAFIIGRLPALLVSLAEAVGSDGSTNVDMRTGLQHAILSVLRRQNVLMQVDHVLTREFSSENAEEEGGTRPFSRDFLQQLLRNNLVTVEIANQIDPQLSNEVPQKWHAEAHDMGLDLSAFITSKLMNDQSVDEIRVWVERIWKDPSSHAVFAALVSKRFAAAVTSMEVDSLGHTCRVLHTFDQALEIVALHERIYDLIFLSLQFLEEYDCETVGDPQTAVSHLGDVVLFVQYALVKFKFENHEFTKNDRTVSSAWFSNVEISMRAHGRTAEDMAMFHTWFKALFNTDGEGIEDNILRATKPKVLLRISMPLVSQAITAATVHKFDREVLMNGISYFTGPLLNWVLVGVIKALFREMQQRQYATPVHYEIIQTLILAQSCPRSVIALVSPQITVLAAEKKKHPPTPNTFNTTAVRQKVLDAIGLKGTNSDAMFAQNSGGQLWHQQVQEAIQTAFSTARSQKAPFLDLKRCLNMVSPMRFLQILWAEIQAAANLGELEACRRIATFALSMPLEQSSTVHHYPLVPIFLHVVLPSIIASIDRQQPPEEQSLRVNLLVAIIASVLNAAKNLERAVLSVSGPDQQQNAQRLIPVLGQTSDGMARRLVVDLRCNRVSEVCKMILQRLVTSQAFIANFPVFKTELGTQDRT
ncbi:mediator complex subunit Med5-domain-containing protein [Crepidotus variabilis]|uniref:Mediator of RNA polymerase II transcription subunit 5 n=1 Tax=Crepidotus variabilis TaxID=179855 RepID=A0A9P6ELK8_9AGAR|nr:mediator complex subunit Med5-domain-containing protein [Crepidotus variabilis]